MPFTIAQDTPFEYEVGDMVFVPGIRQAVLEGKEEIDAKVISKAGVKDIHLYFQNLTKDERAILTDGCLMNYYANQNK
jgi:aconitate hydratase